MLYIKIYIHGKKIISDTIFINLLFNIKGRNQSHKMQMLLHENVNQEAGECFLDHIPDYEGLQNSKR